HFLYLLFLYSTAPPTTHIYTLSLHDALPISDGWGEDRYTVQRRAGGDDPGDGQQTPCRFETDHTAQRSRDSTRSRRVGAQRDVGDRKSTRLNSSHLGISYAVFCLKKKNKNKI